MDNSYLIYCHTSPSGKKYIGQTKDYNRRCRKHQTSKECVAFSNAIIKYGWNSFTHEILRDNLTLEEANILEEFYIKDYNTFYPHGYNLQRGGNNLSPSEITKLKISSTLKNKYLEGYVSPNKGKPMSEETKLKLSKSKRNKLSKNSKLFEVITPSGEVVILFGQLKQYCRDNKLDYPTMINTSKGKYPSHKGFKCKEITSEQY